MPKWEYRRVATYCAGHEYGDQAAVVADRQWVATLNEMGAQGWELVSEVHHGPGGSGPYWVSYNGTMKRPVA